MPLTDFDGLLQEPTRFAEIPQGPLHQRQIGVAGGERRMVWLVMPLTDFDGLLQEPTRFAILTHKSGVQTGLIQ